MCASFALVHISALLAYQSRIRSALLWFLPLHVRQLLFKHKLTHTHTLDSVLYLDHWSKTYGAAWKTQPLCLSPGQTTNEWTLQASRIACQSSRPHLPVWVMTTFAYGRIHECGQWAVWLGTMC